MLAAIHFEEAVRAGWGDPKAVVDGARSDCLRDQASAADCKQRIASAERLAAAVPVARNAALPEIVEAAAQAYAIRFSETELDAITAFYVSPVGQKLIAERPRVEVDLRAAEGRILLKSLSLEAPTGAKP